VWTEKLLQILLGLLEAECLGSEVGQLDQRIVNRACELRGFEVEAILGKVKW